MPAGKCRPRKRAAHENLELVEREVAVCVNIIENILSITRLQPPRKTLMDLGPFAIEAFTRLKQSEMDGHDLEQVSLVYDGHPDPFPIQADPVQFRQVFDNLLKNAVEAMQGPGEIRITARQTAEGHCIEIADTGPGIPLEEAEKIFEVFQTSKIKGTGLGLGISRHIIERHGGTLTVKPAAKVDPSSNRNGATFLICLPPQEPKTQDFIGRAIYAEPPRNWSRVSRDSIRKMEIRRRGRGGIVARFVEPQ